MTKSYCGASECHGHGDYAVCGKPYYDPEPWQCPRCRIKDLEQEIRVIKSWSPQDTTGDKENRSVPPIVTKILGEMSTEEFDSLVAAMLPVLIEQLKGRIQVTNDPWGNPSLRIR